MKLKLIYLLLLSFVFFNSCEYSPTGTNYKEITFTDPNIGLVSLSEDQTTFIRGHIGIPFAAVLNDKNLIAVKAYINNNYLNTYYNSEAAIDFDSRQYPDGFYTIKLELYTTTNTGSLADLSGAEAYILTKQYTIQIFNAPVTTPQITSLQVVNNALNIKWDKYTGPGFRKYVLLAYDEVLAEIYDQDSVEIDDPVFVGGVGDRAIKTYIAGERFESTHQTIIYNQINFISATVNEQNQVVLTWERNIFDNAFGKYKLNRASTDSSYLVEITDINTTSYVDTDPIFGSQIHYGIMTFPKLPVYVYDNPTYITAPPIGQACDLPQHSYLKFVPGMNSFYGYYNSTFKIFDNTMNLIKSKAYSFYTGYTYYNFANSSTGDLIYALSDFNASKIAKINSSTLQVEKVYDIDSLVGRTIGYIDGINVSDDNKLVIICSAYQITSGVYVFDMNTETLIASQDLYESSYSYDVQISKNGKYIRAEDNLYQLNNGTLNFIGNVENYSLFMNDSESIVQFINIDSKAQRLKCSDLSLLSEISFNKILYQPKLKIDPGSNYVGCLAPGAGSFYILDMQTAEIKKRIPIVEYWVLFENMTLFSNNRMLKINL